MLKFFFILNLIGKGRWFITVFLKKWARSSMTGFWCFHRPDSRFRRIVKPNQNQPCMLISSKDWIYINVLNFMGRDIKVKILRSKILMLKKVLVINDVKNWVGHLGRHEHYLNFIIYRSVVTAHREKFLLSQILLLWIQKNRYATFFRVGGRLLFFNKAQNKLVLAKIQVFLAIRGVMVQRYLESMISKISNWS